MYIGIISDTHCWFDDRLKEFLGPVDEIWHAGDFGSEENLLQIAAFKPLQGVYGNCDGTQVRTRVPYTRLFECGGKKVLMMHIGGYPGRYDYRALRLIDAHRPDIFVCGHSHILRVINDRKRDMLVINPGAAGIQGFHQVRTAIRVHIDAGKIYGMEVGEWPRTACMPDSDKEIN
ncbi:MAG TPA: metallophosphoesterase family protein [Candidatus Coprenecus stercoripullorum]|mgnify:CR=1 FL=1|nr:metallophosphoesterase family protein [Candidatus Coprenecus stercoripullorum]